MAKVKVCGLMREEDIDICIDAGVDILGFVVGYPEPVPWNLSAERAAELISHVPDGFMTCIVTGGRPGEVCSNSLKLMPDIVQLHYNETFDETAQIASELKQHGIKTVRALSVKPDGVLKFERPNPSEAAIQLSSTDVFALLVDSFSEKLPGGTGITVNLDVYNKVVQNTHLPVIAAGGITPGNVCSLFKNLHPFAIDVLSGVELSRGIKDREKVFKLVKNARSL